MTSPAVLRELNGALESGRVLTRDVDLRTYSYDAYLDEFLPDGVVLPSSSTEVARIVDVARRYGFPFVPRGRGTNLSGGTVAVDGGLVIELSHMDRVLSVDLLNQVVRVEAGVYNTDVTAAVDSAGFFYAPDPASGKACSIGGNIAEGAGGPHCLKYGVTANHVRALKVVLSNGELVELGGAVCDLPGYDLVGLFIGSEGTLGICTEASLAVLPKPETIRTLLAVYDSIDCASETVSAIIATGILPATLEMMDNLVIQAVEDSFSAGFPRDAAAVLLIEVDGLKEGVEQQCDEVRALCEAKGAVEVRVAHSESEREALWKGRKGAFGAISRLAPNYLVTDGTVPRARLPETLRRVREIAERYDLRVGNVFHAGDGNLHPLILFDSGDSRETERVLRASMEMLAVCVDMGGTVTGEHGIGTEKLDAMKLVFSEKELELQWRVKHCLDPDDLCNPGKVLPPQTASSIPVTRTTGSQQMLREAAAKTEADPSETPWPDPPGSGTRPRLRMRSVDEVGEALVAAQEQGVALAPVGGGTRSGMGSPPAGGALLLSLEGLQAVLELDPANLVIHVEAGLCVAQAQDTARRSGLVLPLDANQPNRATIGGAVACNEQGPRRSRFGSVRDVVLGVGVVLPEGDYVRFGGQTMKNVAGLSLSKLFIGSLGTLGVIVDVWLRLLPAPRSEAFLAVPVADSLDAATVMTSLTECHVAPDMAELLPWACCEALSSLRASCGRPGDARVLLFAFAGDERSVARQVADTVRISAATARVRGSAVLEPSAGGQALVDQVASFRHWADGAGYAVHARALAPPRQTAGYLALVEHAAMEAGLELVSSAGLTSGVVQLAVRGAARPVSRLLSTARAHAERQGGALVLCGGWGVLEGGFDPWGRNDAQVAMMHRLKTAFDPFRILNPGRYVDGI